MLPIAHGSNAPLSQQVVTQAPGEAFELFLDRLMSAESGGRTHAKNPRSTALGPFQFIKSTFLDVTQRHFASEIAGLSEEQVLERRTDPVFSRRAATVFCKEIVGYLEERGLAPTFAHLRLAYLLGPADAAAVLKAKPTDRLVDLLSSAVIRANPFMVGLSAADLISRSGNEVEGLRLRLKPRVRLAARAARTAVARPVPAQLKTCNAKLPSCRKFVALAQKASLKR